MSGYDPRCVRAGCCGNQREDGGCKRPGACVPHRLIRDMKAQGFTQMPASELCGFMVYRFEAERSDIKRGP